MSIEALILLVIVRCKQALFANKIILLSFGMLNFSDQFD